MQLLDLYAENETLRMKYKDAYIKAKSIQKDILEISNKEKEKSDRAEYLKYVIEEIEKTSPKPNELKELSEKKNALIQRETFDSAVKKAVEMLGGDSEQTGVSTRLKVALESIENVKNSIPNGEKITERLSQILIDCDDIYSELLHIYTNAGDEEEINDIDSIEERMFSIERLCKKYGPDENSVILTLKKAKDELEELNGLAYSLEKLASEYNKAKEELSEFAKELSHSRKTAGDELCNKVREALEFLDMSGVTFYANFEEIKNNKGSTFYTSDGTEKIEFLISANVGEEPKPLAKFASGGELSRIILAIKSVLNEKEGTGTLIFDEVDTGVSGKTSYKVGVKLLSASTSSQVFCVTHSAQIASLADSHLKVSKSSYGGRSFTDVTELSREQRTREIARIMGGDIISKTLTDSAKELIANADILKSQIKKEGNIE